MKKILLFPVLLFILPLRGQTGWKQSLHYHIHVKFNPAEKSLDALMKLSYINHSPDTLSFIWFHIWSNAYRNDRTLYSDQLLENGDTRFYFSSPAQKGYLNRLDFRVNGILVAWQDHPEYIDVVKLILPKPLLPGDSLSVSTSFHLRLPFNFNGNGWSNRHAELKNWYPEPAVYDRQGWHPMPFLVQGGAYHEAADYDVEIEAPPAYCIVAGAPADTLTTSPTQNLYHFSLKNANAFAWIADTRYQLKTDSLEIRAGRQIHIRYFFVPGPSTDSGKLLAAAKKEIRQLSEWLTPWPRPSISIVQASRLGDQDFSGLVCMGRPPMGTDWQKALRSGLLGQWFQTILLSNQRDQPWFSRGLKYLYNQRLVQTFPQVFSGPPPVPDDELWLRVAEYEKTTQPITTASPVFSAGNDTLIAANKAGLWFSMTRDSAGSGVFYQTIRDFMETWKFNHPYPDDFKKVLDSATGKNLQPLFVKLNSNVSLFTPPQKKILKPAFIFSARNSVRNNYIGLAPLAGYNRYDQFMLGALIHNINLPANPLEFLFTPLYAFGSKTVEGFGRMDYSWHPGHQFSKIAIGLNGGRFASNKATDSTGQNLFESWSKLVPYIRLEFRPSSPRSHIRKWMDFKTFLITEKTFGRFAVSAKDSLIHPNATSSNFRYVNELSFNLQDDRILYPYGLRVAFQQAALFYRINLQGNYFLNYPGGGGMRVRLFASKFGVWNSNNTAQVSRYEPKLLGVTGEEDYLYENYFVGRSASYALENTAVPNGGWPAQQIMNRDGGLKLRIDGYDYLQGKSAGWVAALNFNTSLPASLFPFPLPLRLFFDVGTYAEAWQNNPPTSRLLYTGGIQLSLFKNLLNIYAPLIYSSDFKDALRTLSFGEKITFSLDIREISFKKFAQKAPDYD